MALDFIIAFLTGAVSFLSPCIIPMIIVYLTTITGFSFDALLMSGNSGAVRRQVFLKTLAFVSSFTLVFTAVGGLAAGLAGAISGAFDVLSWIAGALFLVLGLHYLGVLKKVWRFGAMMDEKKIDALAQRWRDRDGTLSYAGVFVIGLAFALVCSHCISPTLFPTLMLAASSGDALGGSVVMLGFSLGLGSAFLLAALFFSASMERLNWLKKHEKAVRFIVGIIFLGMGLLLLSGQYLSFVSMLYRLLPWKGIGM
ncbi:MAG: cytochrome c biogenesis protein CcdA [Candidatus Micrarchaeota archaeon]